MDKLQKKVLTVLLNKYDNSVISKKGTSRNLKIAISITALFPRYYDSDSYLNKEKINHCVFSLQSKGYIYCDIDDNGDIHAISLCLQDTIIQEICAILERPFVKQARILLIDYLENMREQKSFVEAFRLFLIEELRLAKSIKKYINNYCLQELEDLFMALNALNEQQDKEEIYIRKLSVLLFNNSKKLENLSTKIHLIIKEFYNEFDIEEVTEMFAFFNVMKNPGFIYIKGNCIISINNQIIDLHKLDGPFSLTTKNIAITNIIKIDVDYILTVENLTTFYEINATNKLIIYLGGYHNALRREFLLRVYEHNNNNAFYHFGDIDAGGFYIYYHLLNKTKIPFKTKYMDIETLEKYKKYAIPLTDNDRKRIKKLEETYSNKIFAYMLENNIKLEQEIIEYIDCDC